MTDHRSRGFSSFSPDANWHASSARRYFDFSLGDGSLSRAGLNL